MPAINLSLVIAVAALILSALSPLVSGFFRLKEKKLEIAAKQKETDQSYYYRHRAEVIEQYIRATGQVIEIETVEACSQYGASMGEIYLYVDEALWKYIDNISKSIHSGNNEAARSDFIALCKELSTVGIRATKQDYRHICPLL